jgi:hypothetical protein
MNSDRKARVSGGFLRADAGTRTPDPFITSHSFAGQLPEIPAVEGKAVQLARVRIAQFGTCFGTRLAAILADESGSAPGSGFPAGRFVAMNDPIRLGDIGDPKGRRRAALEMLARYHEEQLRSLLEHVREGFQKLDDGEIDPFELDDLIHHYKRSAQKLC